ncbi:MAG: isochorismatase family protein [Acidobacteriota bacterium]
MELLDVNRSVVTMIDLQGKLMEMIYRPSLVIAASKRLMRIAELFGVPVIMTEQYPAGLGVTHPEVRDVYDALTTTKRYMDKSSFGCCGDPNYERLLAEVRPNLRPDERQVVVAGIEAHVCVMQTVIELLRMGTQVHLCWESVSSRGEEYRRHALERMKQAGAVITNHESVAFEWARDKEHEKFRSLSRLLKEGQLTE